jgi:hypothetical protein
VPSLRELHTETSHYGGQYLVLLGRLNFAHETLRTTPLVHVHAFSPQEFLRHPDRLREHLNYFGVFPRVLGECAEKPIGDRDRCRFSQAIAS